MIIFRYLAKQILVTMSAVTFVLLMIFMGGRFIKFLGQAASGAISSNILLPIMAYRLPSFLELILPLGLLIGILLAYGRMYLESEMTVLQACGMTNRRLLGMTLCVACFVALVVGTMSLFLAPWGMHQTEKLLDKQKKLTEFEMLFPGRFQSLGSSDRVTYMESLSEDKKTMFNVFVADKSAENESLNLIFAESATQQVNAYTGERFLLMHDGVRYQGSPGTYDYRVMYFGDYGMKIVEPDAENQLAQNDGVTSKKLLEADDMKSKALLQWRISLPLLVPIITLLAVPVSRVNPRQGRFFHLFPAMLIYVGYLGLLIVARKRLAEGAIPEWLGLWWVHLLFLVAAAMIWSRDWWSVLIRQRQQEKLLRTSNHAQN